MLEVCCGNWTKMIFFYSSAVSGAGGADCGAFIPALPWLYNAHVYIVPVIVFYGAMALPFPLMLAALRCTQGFCLMRLLCK